MNFNYQHFIPISSTYFQNRIFLFSIYPDQFFSMINFSLLSFLSLSFFKYFLLNFVFEMNFLKCLFQIAYCKKWLAFNCFNLLEYSNYFIINYYYFHFLFYNQPGFLICLLFSVFIFQGAVFPSLIFHCCNDCRMT